MGLHKGCKPNNPNGRPPGKPNRTTEELRGLFQSFIESNIETLQADFDQLEPKDRLSFMERIAKLIIPAPVPELQRLTDDQLNELINKLKNQTDAI
ncbi:MAG: hypothetical protein A2W85_06325 [Bacteroidetes bacterium GWF2_41_31]|nr:MAG: hypothetical protein A2W85_06325 [Bacteroidetes bacterium GWF2_41_31]